MAKFVECIDGNIVNLNHVAVAKRVFTKDKIIHRLYNNTGVVLGELRRHDQSFNLVIATDPVVPAEPGSKAYLIDIDDGDGRPQEKDVYVEIHSIVAWRIHDGTEPTAIFAEQPGSNQKVLIAMPHGRVLDQGHCIHEDLATAKRSLLTFAQGAWDGDPKRGKALDATEPLAFSQRSGVE